MAIPVSPSPEDAKRALPADQIDFVDLYARWEKNNWSAMDLDFTQDKLDWEEKFDDVQRVGARWLYSLFFFGEDEVTDSLSPFIDACPREEQKYFVATQQVDEARHAIFFSRFFREVIGVDARDYGAALASVDKDLTWGLKKVFELLTKVTDELRTDRSAPKLAQAITMYHMIVEGTLAQTGQHFIADSLTALDVMPGFREGVVNVEKDEQRHIAFGVKMLADLNRQDPDVVPAMREILQQVLPYSVNVFRPPHDDPKYVEAFGKSIQDVMATGDRQITQRLTAAGIPLYGPSGVLPLMDPEVTPEDRADRVWTMVTSGFLCDGTQPVIPSDEAMGHFFELMQSSVSPKHGFTSPKVLQWDFTNASPWHITIDNGSAQAAKGAVLEPDIRFGVSIEDWLAITDGRLNIGRALLTRRLKLRGDRRTIMALPKVFQQ